MSIYLNKALSFEVSYDSSLDNIETNNKNIIPHESYHFFTGKNHTEETKQKISESQRGNHSQKIQKEINSGMIKILVIGQKKKMECMEKVIL
jgi:hypothetical protein